MERKCPLHPNSLLCRHRRKDAAVGEGGGSGRVGRAAGAHAGKVGQMKIVVIPTTGGQLEVCVSPAETVRGLKQLLARKYRIAPARIHLLHKERELKDGSLRDNHVTEGSRLVLCPNMESGTSPSRAEHSVVQALKNLSQAQIHDFLSGRAPLTLAIRLGEHLMFVQLQLSTSPSSPCLPLPVPAAHAPFHPHHDLPIPTPTTTTTTTTTPPLSSPTPTPTPTPSAAPPHGASPQVGAAAAAAGGNVRPTVAPPVDPVSLLQASHNLTEKLKELTHLTQQALQAGAQRTQAVPSMPLTPPPSPPPSPGAVIDSMQHMGRGMYSGTFSGTLDPRLQDRSGQPRRDVNTILHILHDLLLARPSSHLAPTSPSPSSSSSSFPYSRPPPTTTTPPSPLSSSGENVAMRHKVQFVQRMLEQRRQRRLTRRLSHRPYPSSSAPCLCTPPALSQTTTTSFPFPPTTAADAHTSSTTAGSPSGTGHGENLETANYRKPNMEQETVAV
ncbi:LOW QUALITY PROTEIN: midnolin-like [Babylonia areolata]|uniref:LOW QUALITY PROTEIN: midnolin-like n=1 Tax=Babylonia areolata TaxID=304850 RepID=UPI003FD493ED